MRAVLTGKSKTVSEMNDTLQQLFTLNSKFRIHDADDSLEILKVDPPCRGGLRFVGPFCRNRLSPQGEPPT